MRFRVVSCDFVSFLTGSAVAKPDNRGKIAGNTQSGKVMPKPTAGPTESVNLIADEITEAASLAADKRIGIAVGRMVSVIKKKRPI